MQHLWSLANRQAKHLKKIKNKDAKKQQQSLLIETLLIALRGVK